MIASDSDNQQGQQIKFAIREQTKDIKSTKYSSFKELGLNEDIIFGLTQNQYLVPTPVQQESIPIIMSKKSLIARAKNGTGKTGAYLIPLLDQISVKSQQIQGVILVPTRQLAQQVETFARKLSKFKKVNTQYFIGGTKVREDQDKIKQKDIQLIVCTVGRLRALLKRNSSVLKFCQYFVLDQADKLLEGSFEKEVEEIISYVPKKCSILMYSATFPVRIKGFKQKFMPKAVVINLMEELMLLGLTHYYMLVDERQKMKAIYKLFGCLTVNQCIIFCRSNKRTQFLSKKLNQKGIENQYLHSQMKGEDRLDVFQRFRKGQFKTLIGSNLIARGVDIKTVNVVINFDFPKDSSTYLHRIGRSGRYGQIGLAVNLITQRDQQNVIKVEHELDTKIDPLPERVDQTLYQ